MPELEVCNSYKPIGKPFTYPKSHKSPAKSQLLAWLFGEDEESDDESTDNADD